MTIINNTGKRQAGAPLAATIGFFDGVHRGHRDVISQLQQLAAQRGLQTTVITFARHPRQVVQPGWRPQLLTTHSEKLQLLAVTGVDSIVVLDFDEAMARMTAQQFMTDILARDLGVRLLLTGYDNHFGRRTADSHEGFDDYVAYGYSVGIDVFYGFPLKTTLDGRQCCVSSSLIRQKIAEGQVEQAAECLGRRYSVSGRVVHGYQQGRRMGFPTANIVLDDNGDGALRLVPANGVYAVTATIDDDTAARPAMTNIGTRPTFDGHQRTIETNILDFNGELYGHRLTISFIRRLRDEMTFPSPDDLKKQMEQDAAQVIKITT